MKRLLAPIMLLGRLALGAPPPPAAGSDPCTMKMDMPSVHDPWLEPGACERARDVEYQRLQREMDQWCGAGVGAACANYKDQKALVPRQYQRCKDHVRDVNETKAKQQELQRQLAEQCRARGAESAPKPLAMPGARSLAVPGAGPGAFPGTGAAVPSPKAQTQSMLDLLSQQQASARDEAIADIAKATQGLDKIKYGGGKKDVERVGATSEQMDDVVGEPPPQGQAAPPPLPSPGGQLTVQRNQVFGPGNGCPDGTVAAMFSCRITPPPDAARCESQTQPGTESGAQCLGALACCVSVRSGFLLLKNPDACPIRRCWEKAGAESTSCPAPTDGSSCSLDWGPADWPSVAKCPRAPPQGPNFPSPPASTLWSAAECSALMRDVASAAEKIDEQHRGERTLRDAWETNGRDVLCPHPCGHGDQLAAIATSLEHLERAMANQAFGLPRGSPRRAHLEQATLYARELAWHLRWWLVQPINGFAWSTSSSGGPYHVWSSASDPLPWPQRSITSLCAELFEAEK